MPLRGTTLDENGYFQRSLSLKFSGDGYILEISNVTLAMIDSIIFKTRPYHWETFEGVRLDSEK